MILGDLFYSVVKELDDNLLFFGRGEKFMVSIYPKNVIALPSHSYCPKRIYEPDTQSNIGTLEICRALYPNPAERDEWYRVSSIYLMIILIERAGVRLIFLSEVRGKMRGCLKA